MLSVTIEPPLKATLETGTDEAIRSIKSAVKEIKDNIKEDSKNDSNAGGSGNSGNPDGLAGSDQSETTYFHKGIPLPPIGHGEILLLDTLTESLSK